MKKIEVYMRTEKLESVEQILLGLGIESMTVTEIKELGAENGHTEIYRGTEYAVSFIPRVRVDLLVREDLVEDCIKVITKHARTGEIGDGKILVMPVEEIISIRTGERGEFSLPS